MSIWDIHYDALYASPIAVDAVLTVACGDPPMALRVIDKTAGISVGFHGVDIETVSPAAMVRASDLASVDRAELRDATIAFNGKTWTVRSHAIQPSPAGEAAGEILLILSEQ